MIWGAGRDEAMLTGYADAGVDEVLLLLSTQPESETLRDLDELAAFVAGLT